MEITGRITHDAISKKLASGKQVINFSIAINDQYKAKDSTEVSQIVTYVNCSFWRSNTIADYLKKGTLVELFGRIGLNVYSNADGKALGSLTFHVNNLKILVFAKSNASTPIQAKSNSNPNTEADDLPF
jgi:single-strand DNA-binding protein